MNLSDAVYTFDWLFTGGPPPPCPDAADSDDNGEIEVTDPVHTLRWLFLGEEAPSAPGPTGAGPDPTQDGLEACIPNPRCL